jgi:hypothetical protein
VFRGTEAQPLKREWQKMRKGVADLPRRAEVSKRANERYALMLEAAQCTKPLKDVAEPLCRRLTDPKHRARALNPLSREDALLLEIVNRGEFAINGFRNRDVRKYLHPVGTTDLKEQKRRAAATIRELRLLRAHGLINKVPKTHRYMLSARGREAVTTMLAARTADVPTLLKAAQNLLAGRRNRPIAARIPRIWRYILFIRAIGESAVKLRFANQCATWEPAFHGQR